MKIKRSGITVLLSLFIIPFFTSGQPIDAQKLKTIRLKQYPVIGLMWKGENSS